MSQERRRFERRASERERALMADRLITAEQEERRRLALELHDGPVQSLAGIALMLDSVGHALEDGRVDEARERLEGALKLHRETIRFLRDLSSHLEPVVLRDHGLAPAVQTLADEKGQTHGVRIEVRLDGAQGLAGPAEVALYQILREALNQALGRGPKRVDISVRRRPDGGVDSLVEDDGAGERRRDAVKMLEERARLLDGEVSSAPRRGGGTTLSVTLPAHAVRG